MQLNSGCLRKVSIKTLRFYCLLSLNAVGEVSKSVKDKNSAFSFCNLQMTCKAATVPRHLSRQGDFSLFNGVAPLEISEDAPEPFYRTHFKAV